MSQKTLLMTWRDRFHALPDLFINIALILYPVSVLLVPKMNGLIFGLFVLISLVFVIRYREISFKVSKDEAQLYLSIGIFFLATLIVTVNAGFVYKIIGKYLHLLLAIPIYIYLRHYGVKLTCLWYGVVAGAVVSAIIAGYEVGILGLPRAHSLTHPIVFGDLALLMGCLALAGFGWFKQRASWQMALPVLALLCGVIASALSQSRGGWVAVPFLILVFFWYIRSIFSFRIKFVLAVGFALVLGGLYAIPQTGVEKRVDKTVKNLQAYSESEISSSIRGTSVGTRLEMWQASWKMFLDHPLLGIGWGHYKEEAQKQVDQGLRNRSAASFNHPHNQFFSALAHGGVLGLAGTLLLFLTPAWLFIKYIKQKQTEDTPRLALAGLLLIVAYMAFGISEPMLDRSRSVNFFAFYLVILMATIQGRQRD